MALLNELLDAVDQLPSVPAVAVQLSAMIAEGENNAADIENLIRQDDGLAATILRVANSARWGAPGRTLDLHGAIVRLGVREIAKIALDDKIAQTFATAGCSFGLRRGALWRSAVAGAVAAEQLALRCGGVAPDLAYLCGLLRDIGKLALDTYFGEDYFRQVDEAQTAERTFAEAERAAFGIDHAEVGGVLAKKWGFPDVIVDAIRRHHAPPDGEQHSLLCDVVHAGDVVALYAGLGLGQDGLRYRLDPRVREELGLTRDHIEEDVMNTWIAVHDLEEALFNSREAA